jgi:hypothetical protein
MLFGIYIDLGQFSFKGIYWATGELVKDIQGQRRPSTLIDWFQQL